MALDLGPLLPLRSPPTVDICAGCRSKQQAIFTQHAKYLVQVVRDAVLSSHLLNSTDSPSTSKQIWRDRAVGDSAEYCSF